MVMLIAFTLMYLNEQIRYFLSCSEIIVNGYFCTQVGYYNIVITGYIFLLEKSYNDELFVCYFQLKPKHLIKVDWNLNQ